jgi:hypothetical protein
MYFALPRPSLQVDAGASLNAGGFAGYDRVTVAGTLATTGAGDAAIVTVGSGGALTVGGGLSVATSFTVNGTVNIGVATVGGGVSGTGTTTVNNGASLSTDHVRQSSLALSGNAVVTINPDGGDNGVSKVGSLTIAGGAAPTARLDVKDNDLIVDYAPGSSPINALTDQIKAGYNAPNLRWDGQGITSTTARDSVAQTTTLGIIDNIDPDGAGPLTPRLAVGSSFGGFTVDDSMVIFKYTYFGDVTLDGSVDAADYALIDNGFNFQGVDPSLRNWANGDMNLDGSIDAADYALIDNAFNFQTGPLAAADGAPLALWSGVGSDTGASVVGSAATASSAVTPVPEPGTLALLVLGGLALLPVRRNRKRAA